jgi:hypothetical protein
MYLYARALGRWQEPRSYISKTILQTSLPYIGRVNQYARGQPLLVCPALLSFKILHRFNSSVLDKKDFVPK